MQLRTVSLVTRSIQDLSSVKNSFFIMQFAVLFGFALISFASANDCVQRRNYLSYKFSGINKVDGMTEDDVQNAVVTAFSVWTSSIADLWFVTEPIYSDNFELEIEFTSFTEKFKLENFTEHVAFTRNNCTCEIAYEDNETCTIYNSEIFFNTDFLFKSNVGINSKKRNGIDLYLAAVHEVGHALGFPDNNNPESIMNRRAENFDVFTFNNTALPTFDLDEIKKRYVLKK